MHVLLDNFAGSPQDFYNHVVGEIRNWEFPDVQFSWREEVESTKLLRSGEKAQALQISFRGDSIVVLAFQIGKCIVISTRRLIASNRDKAGILHELSVAAFEEVIKRAVRSTLKRVLEERALPIPDDLKPENVFFTPFDE